MEVKRVRVDDLGGIKLVCLDFHLTSHDAYDICVECAFSATWRYDKPEAYRKDMGTYVGEMLARQYEIRHTVRGNGSAVFTFADVEQRDAAMDQVAKFIVAHKLSYVEPG